MRDFLSILFDPITKGSPLEALKTSIRANEDEIMDLNRQQLDRGLDSKGKTLGRYANFKYKGRWQPVDLKKTGDFRDKFSLQIDDKATEIFSQDEKEAKLKKRYGKEIFGVPAPLINNVREIVRDEFINDFRKQVLK